MKAQIGVYPKDRQILHEIVPLETPLVLDLHITQKCNFRCNYCYHYPKDAQVAGRPLLREHMEWELFEDVIEQLRAFPRKIKMVTMGGGGENLLHPRIADMVRLLRESGVTDRVQIISNASLLTPKMSDSLVAAGLDELKISLQGLSTEKYQQIAGVKADWEKIHGNIRYFSSVRGNCELRVKIADTALEEGDEEIFYALFGDICDAVAVEHIFNLWKANGINVTEHMLPVNRTKDGLELRDVKVCRRMFTSCDVQPDGLFTLFCHAHFGFERNIREVSLYEQWNGDELNRFRRKRLNHIMENWQCRACEINSGTWLPEDDLDGHEAEILARMDAKG
jgi:MoaA/NifB/PqqE/SkfB family radical SAM enzyme